jgi:tyrosinase
MELKLRDQIRAIAGQQAADDWRLPYWDWAAADTKGLPAAFTDETYVDNSKTRPNPLLKRPYQLPYAPGDPVTTQKVTYRKTGTLAALQVLRSQVTTALDEPDFTTFSRAIERPHNGLHVWVNGYMATFRSSFDPIFWVHHCNIDRYFWIWREKFGDATVPASVKAYECQPFRFKNIRAEAFFDTRAIGYTYAETRTAVARAQAQMFAVGDAKTNAPSTLSVDLGRVPEQFSRARVHFHGIEHTEKTYEIRIFANPKTMPTASTPTTDKGGFVGSYHILGHGTCPGAPGHCDAKATLADGVREQHHLSPYDLMIDVTEGLKRIPKKPISMAFVVVDLKGKQVPAEILKFDDIALTAH